MPTFAKGAVVNSPTIALVGEKGPEAVVPVRKLAASKAGRKILKSLRADRLQQMGAWHTRRQQRKVGKA